MSSVQENTFLIRSLFVAFIATIMIFFIGDVARNLAMSDQSSFIRYTAISKGVVLFIYVVVFALNFRFFIAQTRARYWLLALLVLIGSFLLSQLTGDFEENKWQGISKNLVYVSRFLYLPVTFLLFYPLMTITRKTSKIFRLFEVLFFLNCALILLGAIFDIAAFRTYDIFTRYGYMGIYNSNNQASYYFILMIIYYYHQVSEGSKPYKLIFVVLCALLLGTKKIYLFLPLLVAYDFFRYRRYKNKWLIISIVAIMGIAYLLRDNILAFLEKYFNALVVLQEKKGWLSMLSSTRDAYLKKTYENVVVGKWEWYNYIIGGADFYNNRSEMELFDIFFFFGIIGLLVYAWFIKDMMQYFRNMTYLWVMMAFLLFIAALASGFLVSANQPIAFLLVFSLVAFGTKAVGKVSN